MLLAGDIGGTKTNLAIFSSQAKLRTPVYEATFQSARYPSLEALVSDFLSQVSFSVERAVFGVAGPVVEGKAKITNLPWIMEEEQLEHELHIPLVRLLNDLNAMAHGVPLLQVEDLHTLNEGVPVPDSVLAVIAPGTGLGEAFLTWDGAHYRAHSSEGGHADFAPTNVAEIELLRYLLGRFDHVSYEQVCSGIGLPNVYDALKHTAALSEPEWLAEKLTRVKDATPMIIEAALSGQDAPELCVATLKTFASILAAEAGNLALKVLATDGVYIGGGIPPRILPFLKAREFMRIFQNKGRFSEMLSRVPVHVILNPPVGLFGAAHYGFNL